MQLNKKSTPQRHTAMPVQSPCYELTRRKRIRCMNTRIMRLCFFFEKKT